MNEITTLDVYGVVSEPDTLTMQRFLPGPIERIWAYLTESELRRRWLASGEMALEVGAPFELVWRNDELSTPPGARPEGFSEEHRMQSRIVELDPPRKLVYTWGERGQVSFELEEQGDDVLLTLVHRGLPDRAIRLMICAGWHVHLEVLAERAAGREPAPFWDRWSSIREDYDRRLPA